MGEKRGKGGQVTIFIIIAIVFVAVILLLFYKPIKSLISPTTPSLGLQDCVGDKLDESVNLVSKRGGSIEPSHGLMYRGEKIEYLCYINEYYKTCTMQTPLLKQHIEREILENVRDTVKACLGNMKKDLTSRGYIVSGDKEEIKVEIVPNSVKLSVSGFSVSKGDTGERYEKFVVEKKSEIYDLLMLSTSILNWEARYGDSDITIYMLYYPDIKVEKYKQQDGSTIYMLSSKETKDKFVFASRSVAWPPGYGISKGVLV